MTGRDRISLLLNGGKSDRLPYIPLVFRYAGHLNQLMTKEMLQSPTRLAQSLILAQELLGQDGIINAFDHTLEAEACGCQLQWADENAMPVIGRSPWEKETPPASLVAELAGAGRIPVVLEATRHVKAQVSKKTALIGVVTGVATIARQLGGASGWREELFKFASQIVVQMCRIYGELQIDAIALQEPHLGLLDTSEEQFVLSHLKTVFNILNYYDVSFILMADTFSGRFARGLGKYGISAIIGKGYEDADVAIGQAIPTNVLLTGDPLVWVSELQKRTGSGRYFLTTEEQVPSTVPASSLMRIRAALEAGQFTGEKS